MASILLGPSLSQVTGSIGSTVFAKNRGGAYIRGRVRPSNPQSPKQSLERGYLALCQSTYRDTLSAAQRDGWEAAAAVVTVHNRLGQPIKLSACNLFAAVNTLRLRGSQAIIEACPTPPLKAGAPTCTFSISNTAGVTLATPSPALASGDRLFVYASAAQGNQVNFYKSPWPHNVIATSASTFPLEIVPPADVAVGDRIFLQYRFQNAAGRFSPMQTLTLDCTT